MSGGRAPRAPALRYRAARRTDVETLADLGWRAYRVSSLEKRREFYTDHPRFGLRDIRIGELDGQVVSSLVLYPLTVFVRGQIVIQRQFKRIEIDAWHVKGQRFGHLDLAFLPELLLHTSQEHGFPTAHNPR